MVHMPTVRPDLSRAMAVGNNGASAARRVKSVGLLSSMAENINSMPNPNQIMVSNLPFQASQEDLEGFFSQAGSVVSAKIITDRETGRSKGYGFVLFAEPLGATYALERMQGASFGGRPLTIRPALRKTGGRPRQDDEM